MRSSPLVIGLSLLWTAVPDGASAQFAERREPSSFVQQQKAFQDQSATEFDAYLAETQRIALDWGGWYGFHVFQYDDGVESSRTLRRHDLRLWSRASIDRSVHEFYFRVRTSVLDYNAGDSYDRDEDDVEGPSLERGLYRLDLDRALGWDAARPGLALTLGRDLVAFGTGLALATPLDHASLQAEFGDFGIRSLAGRTVGSSTDIDLTRPIDRSRRAFYGAEVTYRRPQRHRPFAFVLWQRDHNSDGAYPLLQDYDYDSFYAGIGSMGELADRWRYSAELVYEGGAGSNRGPFAGRNEINAFAADFELEYLAPGPRRPRFSVEYLFGSGDSDRRFSPTDTIGGNRGDHSDNSFVGFGYQYTGLSAALLPSNLHMLRAGASIFPCPDSTAWRRLELGTDWFLFHKHHRDGAISDPTADERSGYVGWEMDYFANWKATADLAWTTRVGFFFPGDGYSDESPRAFVLFGVVWSF